MALIKLKKGVDLHLKGGITDESVREAPASATYAVIPDDYEGVTPRLDKKEGERVLAGEILYHDKGDQRIKITSPVSGVVKEVRRGERRKIEAIVIENDGKFQRVSQNLNAAPVDVLLQSGLWAMIRQRPYDIVPSPDVTPRDIFVTAFDSAPLAPSLTRMVEGHADYLSKGVEVLKSLTEGDVYLTVRQGDDLKVPGTVANTLQGPHPAGNVGVQIANIKPVNKGETVWCLDVVTLCRIGQLFCTGQMDYSTIVTVVGEQVKQPHYVKATMGCSVDSLLDGELADNDFGNYIISGNVLTGHRTDLKGWLRAPFRQLTVIPETKKKDEFMGWASLNPNRFSIYHTFTSWLTGNKHASLDARIKGGERGIVRTGEYDAMLPMDIYAEFLIKSIIAFDIDKMEQLGIYEVAPEDFALAEYADTSKLELQRIVRQGLNKMLKEMV